MLENISAQTAALCIPRLDKHLEEADLKFAKFRKTATLSKT